MTLSEGEVGDAALDWLAGFRWSIAHGADIEPGTPGAERTDYSAAVVGGRSRGALERLNPNTQVKLSTTPEPVVRAPHRWRPSMAIYEAVNAVVEDIDERIDHARDIPLQSLPGTLRVRCQGPGSHRVTGVGRRSRALTGSGAFAPTEGRRRIRDGAGGRPWRAGLRSRPRARSSPGTPARRAAAGRPRW